MLRTVAKVTVEAPVVSFRYPHFLIGRQPTFDMPPPSTIFGHVASALGNWPSSAMRFAYVFRTRGASRDLEHQHVVTANPGKFPVDIVDPYWKPPEPLAGKKPKKKDLQPRLLSRTTEATVQPHERDFLFDAKLELYLDPPELAEAFRSPVFTVVLGRSQDLASVTRVEAIDVEPSGDGYLEHTLLPGELRARLPWGATALMPRYISPPPLREPVFAPYILLRERVFVGKPAEGSGRYLIRVEGDESPFFVDPTTDEHRGGRRLLYFHEIDPNTFVRSEVTVT